MPMTAPPTPATSPPDDGELRAAGAAGLLGRVRAGVRQRQSELAASAGADATKQRLLELRTLEYVEEPPAHSSRQVLGRALVFLRKAFFHLFYKWWARPVLQRQNQFNQVASQLLHELAGNHARMAEALAAADRRLEELEGRPQTSPAPPAAEKPADGASS